MTRRAGGVASIRSWGLPAWTEERRERSDWSDEGRPGARAPCPAAPEAWHQYGHGASRPGLRSVGSAATGATREGREPGPHDPPRRRRGIDTVMGPPGLD